MFKYYIYLFISTSSFFYTHFFCFYNPFPEGIYTSIRHRISSEEPNAYINTSVKVYNVKKVTQTTTLTDVSLDSYAAFKFDGEFSDCASNYCEYSRKGVVLLTAEIHQPLFKSKYLELLSKANDEEGLKSTVELLFISKNVVIVRDKSTNTPYFYAYKSK